MWHRRAYNLGDPVQRTDFVEDFRLVAATNILKVRSIQDHLYILPYIYI
jgi:hypothetical protein